MSDKNSTNLVLFLFDIIVAAGATLFTAGDFHRTQRAVFAVEVVFAFANVAFDVFVFVLHIKRPPLSLFLL